MYNIKKKKKTLLYKCFAKAYIDIGYIDNNSIQSLKI